MITIAIIVFVGMGIILGYSFRGAESCCEHWDYDIKSGKLSSLETRIFILQRDNERLNYIVNKHHGLDGMFKENMCAHCCRCEKTFLAKDQDIADKLKNINLSSEEIAKKLGFEIK